MGILGAKIWRKVFCLILKKILAECISLLRYSRASNLQPSVVRDTGNNRLV